MGLRRSLRRGRGIAFVALALAFVSPIFAPQLLAFPYYAESSIGPVRSERPIDRRALDRVAARTRTLLAQSPIAGPDEQRPIFLTDGGWRWLWLAQAHAGSLAITRPLSRAVVVNASQPAADCVTKRACPRTLSGVLAHEFVHGIIRRRYGPVKAMLAPQWLAEGYADHVAQESRLTAADVARLEARGEAHPALVYYHGRRRVETLLAANGGDVDALFD